MLSLAVGKFMKLRILSKDEYHKLPSDYDNFPETEIAVLEIGDEIISFAQVSYILHVGPIYTKPEFRRRGFLTKVINFLESHLKQNCAGGYYMFPSNEESISLVKKLGLCPFKLPVWERRF